MIESHLFGPEKREQYIEKVTAQVKNKQPSKWRLPDVKLVQLLAIDSPQKIQSFIEESLFQAPIEYLGELLFSLSKCYTFNRRISESLKCLELSSSLLYKYWGRCPSYEMVKCLQDMLYPEFRGFERFMSVLSDIPQ